MELPAEQEAKRSLVHIDAGDWDQWLRGTTDEVMTLIRPQPVEVFDQADALKMDRLLAEGASAQSALF